jgi:hypothetical protein
MEASLRGTHRTAERSCRLLERYVAEVAKQDDPTLSKRQLLGCIEQTVLRGSPVVRVIQ